ncbi:PTS sugar transporter subunit IIB [Marinococcus halophilus]|uniref:PTS sugar transporter subunit IIB n=1 Tax=Marinococcus halophilus TaxID=1371 RepID=UPI0036146CB8
MKKILVVCGNGLGSSMMVEMNVNSILKEMNEEADVSHTDLTTAKTESADLYIPRAGFQALSDRRALPPLPESAASV